MLTLLQNPFIGIYELRKNFPRILTGLQKTSSPPVVVTKRGKPAAVVMAVEYYLELIESIRDLGERGYLARLDKAVEEVKRGGGVGAKKLYKELGLLR